jgi:hypothetical protein
MVGQQFCVVFRNYLMWWCLIEEVGGLRSSAEGGADSPAVQKWHLAVSDELLFVKLRDLKVYNSILLFISTTRKFSPGLRIGSYWLCDWLIDWMNMWLTNQLTHKPTQWTATKILSCTVTPEAQITNSSVKCSTLSYHSIIYVAKTHNRYWNRVPCVKL